MEHDHVLSQLSLLIDGELDDERERDVRAHLEACASCRAEYEELRATLAQLSGLRPIAVPPAFASDVQQRIRKRSRGRFFQGDNLLKRVPFEWISFVIILLMLFMYYTVMVSYAPVSTGPAKATSASQPAAPSTERPHGKQ